MIEEERQGDRVFESLLPDAVGDLALWITEAGQVDYTVKGQTDAIADDHVGASLDSWDLFQVSFPFVVVVTNHAVRPRDEELVSCHHLLGGGDGRKMQELVPPILEKDLDGVQRHAVVQLDPDKVLIKLY